VLELFDYQQDGIDRLRAAYAAGKNAPLLVLPTGGGKTVCFTYMAARAREKGLKVLLLAHRRELVGQISAALKQWDVEHGVISPADKATGCPVQVAMAQTLTRRVKLDKSGRFKFDLVIVDEAHHAVPDSTWGFILAHNAGAKLLGVTATPCRLDGKGLGAASGGFFDHIVVGPSVADLIGRGRLAKPVVYAPDKAVDLSGVKQRGGDYVAAQLVRAVDKSAITGDAVAHYQKYCDRQPAIAFTVTVEHAGHVVEQFKAAGYSAAVLTGSTPDKERARMIRDLGRGDLQVLASCNVVSEGTDIPKVAAAILLRPTASYSLAMQQIGRALRCYPGKDKAIILDHAGNTLRHGLPTDPVEWSLAGLSKRSKPAPVKRCEACGAVAAAGSKTCRECGYEFPMAECEPMPLAGEPGELVEMTPEKLRELRRRRFREEKRAASVEEVARIGRERGYKHPNGWARHRFMELHG
jgi:superfamily II DNA or RNA helicase